MIRRLIPLAVQRGSTLIRPRFPIRYNSTNDEKPKGTPLGKIDKPTYQLTFTCKACGDRSSHLVSKQAYHGGTVLIQCPSCKNRHLIADNLKIFGDNKRTLEDILKAKGENVTKGTIDLNKIGDLEWEPNGEPKQIE